MNQKIEKEVKFFISELEKVEVNLIHLGAACSQPKTFETNL